VQNGKKLRDAGRGDAGHVAKYLRETRCAAEEVLENDVLDAQVCQFKSLALCQTGTQGSTNTCQIGDEQDI